VNPIEQIELIIMDKVNVEVLPDEITLIGTLNAAIQIVQYLKEIGIELLEDNEDLK
jgi:hypothetical protein